MAANDYHRGEMDIAEHKATYAMFGELSKWGSLFVAVSLVLLTLWFCTPAGFGGGAIAALVVLVLGWAVLKKKPSSAH